MTTPTAPPPTKLLPGTYKPSSKAVKSFGVCIYGRGGVGKTSILRTMPGRGLVIDIPQVEGGTFVLEEAADRIDVFPVSTWDDIQTAFWYLKKEAHPYRWVAIDSLTAMTELAKRKIVADREVVDLTNKPHRIRIQDWGDIGQIVAEMIFQFRLLDQHTIWLAQETTHGSDERPPIMVGPDTRGKALDALLPSMLLTGRLYMERNSEGEFERRLRIGPHDLYTTKYRSKAGIDVPSVIVDPDLGQILKFLFGQGDRPREAEDASSSILFTEL